MVKRLQSGGRLASMVGDGIHDAPALTLAQVGTSIATGADVAMESAPVTLVKGDLAASSAPAFYSAAGVPIAATGSTRSLGRSCPQLSPPPR